MMQATDQKRQRAVGVGVVVLALGWGWGAMDIPSDAGYAGIGPNFLPWVVAAALLLCGVTLLVEAGRGGFKDMEEPSTDEAPFWPGFVWMSAGLLLNAALITSIGFVFSCAICFVLAARGLRSAQGQASGGLRAWLMDSIVGMLIAAPVYWMFTKFLAINLPGLTGSGWL
jgi:putative tricarboxylic transport membrane protein